ncbi:MAG: YhdP family protein [Marinobacterium sp.]|nr:YhdP family protein [Marinobacterium sp.]
MKKTARRFWWGSYWLLVTLSALLAVLVLALRLLLPRVELYIPELERWLAAELQAEVQIEALQGQWQGGLPMLQLQGLHLQQTEGLTLSLQQAEVGLDLGQSILQFRPVFSRLRLIQPEVTLLLPEAEQIASSSSSDTTIDADLSAFFPPLWVLDQPLDVRQGAVHIRFPDQRQLTLKDMSAGLTAMGRTWQLKLSAQVGVDETFSAVHTVVEGQGAPQRGRVWLYGELQGLPPEVLNLFLPLSMKLSRADLRQQFWARIQEGKLQLLQSRTDFNSIKLVDNQQLTEQWQLDDSRLIVDLQPRGNGYQVQLHNSELTLNGQTLALPLLAANIERHQQRWWLNRVQLPQLSLAAVSSFLSRQPLSDDVKEIISSLNLRGDIQNLNAHWNSPQWQDIRLVADLNQLAMDAWDDVPQILGINGRLEASLQGGSIHLNSQDFTLNFPTLFPQAWRYNQADGVVGWSFTDNAAVIHSELLHLQQQDIEAHGRFSLRLPFDGGQTDLTLMIGTKNADGRVASRYVPPEEIGVDTWKWLKKAIRKGTVRQGGFLLSGGTRSRLDNYQLPAVQMFFDVEDAEFAFQRWWPVVKQGEAYVLYKDGALSVDITAGQLLKSKLERSWVGLHPDASRLDVLGGLKGDAADVRTLLLESPLREVVGDELKHWRLSGGLKTDITLSIPLVAKQQPEIDIQSQIEQGRLYSPGYRLDFTDLNGKLAYRTPYGLEADKLTAQFMGSDASVRIESAPLSEASEIIRTQVQLDSRVQMATLRDWLELPFLNIAQGETWYRARLNLCQGETTGCSGLDVRSGLQGIEVVGPQVLAKPAEQQRYFQMTSDLQRPRELISLRYGDDVHARLQLVDQVFERGRIAFHQSSATLPPDPGLRVIGSVPELKFERLMQLIERAGLLKDDGGAAPVGSRSQMLHSIALNIGRLSLDTLEIDNLDTLVKPDRKGWTLDMASDLITGSVLFPANGDPYQINVAGLNLQSNPQAKIPLADDVLQASPVQPDVLPHANVVVRQLKLDGKPMGRWSFVLLPDTTGVTIRNIQGQLAQVGLQGELRWTAGEWQHSDLTIKLDGGDLGSVLQRWGHGRALENRELGADLQLEWPGAPWQFRVGRADGGARFVIKKGRLVETGAGSNFLRLFGILNLNALGRRLRLDFSDLFEKGVAFDRMEGNYLLNQGVASTRNSFIMKGPSVDMKLDGYIDLENETLNKRMEVTLPVTSNLPVVGVLLGAAPQVAGAVFLIDKLIGDELKKFTSIRYNIHGSWGDPQFVVPGRGENKRSSGAVEGMQGTK